MKQELMQAETPQSNEIIGGKGGEQTLSLAQLAILVWGLGSFLGWGMIRMSPSIFPSSSISDVQLAFSGFCVQNVISMLILFLLALLSLRNKSLSEHHIIIGAMFFTVVGTALRYNLNANSHDLSILAFTSSILCSSSVIFGVLWGKYLCLTGERNAILCITLAFATSFLLALLAASLPPLVGHIFYSTLPLISGIFLGILQRELPDKPAANRPRAQITIPFRFFVGVLLFGVVFCTMNTLSEAKSELPDEFTTFSAGLVASIMIAVLVRSSPRKMNFVVAFRWILPLLLLIILIVLGAEKGQQSYEVFAIGFGWVYFQVFTWVMWRAVATHSSLPIRCTFSLGELFLSAATFLSFLLDKIISIIGGPTWTTAALVCLLATLDSTFLLSDQYLINLVSRRSIHPESLDAKTLRTCVLIAAEQYGLTQREQAIAVNVLEGRSNEEIQEKLFIANGTLRTHLRNIYKKTVVHSRSELISLLLTLID